MNDDTNVAIQKRKSKSGETTNTYMYIFDELL